MPEGHQEPDRTALGPGGIRAGYMTMILDCVEKAERASAG